MSAAKAAVLFVLAGLAGCTSTPETACQGEACSPPPPPSCVQQFAGNVDDVQTTAPGCGVLEKSMTGGWALEMTLGVAAKATDRVEVDLGPSPTIGTFSSETILSWSVLGSSAKGCLYAAGNASVPTGSFSLTLTSLAGLDGATGVAHGDIEATQTVQAPLMVDCGPGDEEQIRVDF